MDHEDRANRFLSSLECVRDLLAGRAPDLGVEPEPLAQLLAMLTDEARLVVTPVRFACNDDGGGG
jgi:hypothetical protein